MTDKTRAEFEAAATAYREDRAKHDPAFLLTESERTFGWRMWQAALATKAAEPVVDEFCWLVELFEGDGTGNSAGWYHTGFVDIGGYSRTTKHAHEARRYATAAEAAQVAKKLGTTLTGTWKAVEHGFQAPPPPAPLQEPPEGWVLVPREPTPEMLAAMDGADDTDFEVGRGGDYEKMYAAAIEAAQPAQAEKKETP